MTTRYTNFYAVVADEIDDIYIGFTFLSLTKTKSDLKYNVKCYKKKITKKTPRQIKIAKYKSHQVIILEEIGFLREEGMLKKMYKKVEEYEKLSKDEILSRKNLIKKTKADEKYSKYKKEYDAEYHTVIITCNCGEKMKRSQQSHHLESEEHKDWAYRDSHIYDYDTDPCNDY